ncbi:DUF4144 family protein [Rheinheimera marina]|uniref:DUF4144 family protein n=1 Tax=Rheinheimera marina TaxID=1774958 RepID=A0ABV9JNP3_9GAMM
MNAQFGTPLMHYPVLLQLSGDPELEFVESAEQLNLLLRQTGPVLPEDRWIDCQGFTYALHDPGTKLGQLNQDQLTALIQAHFFSQSQSCVVKIQAKSIAELLALLRPEA